MVSTGQFDEAVRQHRSYLLRVALRILHDRDDAEDALQEALVQAHRKLPDFRGASKLKSWLHVVVKNYCFSYRRNKLRRDDKVAMVTLEPTEEFCLAEMLEADEDLEADTVSRDEARKVMEAVERCLRRKDDAVCVGTMALYEFSVGGLEYSDIAKLTGVPFGTVKSRINRGRNTVRRELAREGLIDG